MADDLLLASDTLSEATSLAVAFRRRQLLLLEHLAQRPSPAVMEAKEHVIARAGGGRSDRHGERDGSVGKADQSSRFDGALSNVAVPAPIAQAGPPSVASDVDPAAGGEDVAALSSAEEENRTVNAGGAPFACTGGDIKCPEAVVLAEGTSEGNERRQALFSQTTHGMGSLDASPPTKDLLARAEGDPTPNDMPTAVEKNNLPIADSSMSPVTATSTPTVSGSPSTNPGAVAHSGGNSAGADTTRSARSGDRPTDMENAVASETVVSFVACSTAQGLPAVPEHQAFASSDSSKIAAAADRSTGDTSIALESPSTTITGGSQGLEEAAPTKEAAPGTDSDSLRTGDAWPDVPCPFDMRGSTVDERRLWIKAATYRIQHPYEKSTREWYRQRDLYRERQRSESTDHLMRKTAPLPGAQGWTAPTA